MSTNISITENKRGYREDYGIFENVFELKKIFFSHEVSGVIISNVMCHPVGYKEAFMPKIFFSFQLIHEWLSISVPKVYRLGLFFSWLDGSKYILSVKVAWSILDLELKAHFLTSLEVDVLK